MELLLALTPTCTLYMPQLSTFTLEFNLKVFCTCSLRLIAIDLAVSSTAVWLLRYGADLDALSPKGWTALSYAKAKGKYGPTEEKGIYPEVTTQRP